MADLLVRGVTAIGRGILGDDVVPLYDAEWDRRREGAEFAPSSGKVPILWDGEAVVWDSLAIIEYLADKVGRDRFWPKEDDARALARSSTLRSSRTFPGHGYRSSASRDSSESVVDRKSVV